MKSLRLKQFAISLLAVLSLFLSAVSACACSHHREKRQETESLSSCHEHPAKTVESNNSGATETNGTAISESGCVCFQTAPKAFAKSETVKFEKHAPAISLTALPAAVPVQLISPVKIDFTKPFYLSDSFYNISPGRAPPVL